MEVWEALNGLKKKARSDEALRQKLLDTKNNRNPVSTFCRISTEEGFPLYEMDLIAYGEDSYASMKRSTNGGGENSPMLEGEDDYYEMFLSGL
ncbi:MAG: hypothetical protein IJ123_07040 [Blautia sp.]|nr:hypothetical protein [Blautia sp.]